MSEPSEHQKAELIRRRMAWFDALPPALRAVANGLPNPDYLFYAVEDGCTTQEEAEEWLRRQIADGAIDSPYAVSR